MSDDAHFRLRVPLPLKQAIEDTAKANNRSINAEILATLEKAYPLPVRFDLDEFAATWIEPILAVRYEFSGVEGDYEPVFRESAELIRKANMAAQKVHPNLGVWERIVGNKWEVVFGVRDRSLLPAETRSYLNQHFPTMTWRRW